MSVLTQDGWQMSKRLAVNLDDKTRVVTVCYRHYRDREVVIWCDSDFAGCKRTRQGTSGRVILFGSHFIKSWSNTQTVIAMSSGKAAYYAMDKVGTMTLGVRRALSYLGIDTEVIKIKTDASAAEGIASRRGRAKSDI